MYRELVSGTERGDYHPQRFASHAVFNIPRTCMLTIHTTRYFIWLAVRVITYEFAPILSKFFPFRVDFFSQGKYVGMEGLVLGWGCGGRGRGRGRGGGLRRVQTPIIILINLKRN